ncbi:MAG TPA: Lrp/AsnC family transcriptional regulator [Thermoplasmata archaeon]|nr:Lrp/AsnC family transcriptional regulator [Thermoplasmata archaeon]
MTVDWELYRELYASSEEPVWGMFPHPSLARIAARLNVTRNTVWRRMGQWTESGFVRGYEVIPHPSLLGVGLGACVVTLPDPRDKPRFLDELDLVDGVFLASYDVGPKVVLVVVTDLPESQDRRRRSIERLRGVSTVGPTGRVRLPLCRRQMSRDEWRLLAALRQNPSRSIDELATAVGSSTKTVSRRLRALRRANAMLSHIVEDFSGFPGTVASYVLRITPGVDSRVVARSTERRIPGLLEVPRLDVAPRAPAKDLIYWQEVPTVAAIETSIRQILEVSGIDRVDSYFTGGERAYRGWFDERINQAIVGSLARG